MMVNLYNGSHIFKPIFDLIFDNCHELPNTHHLYMLSLFRASSYAERLRLRIAVIHGQKEVEHDDDETDGRNSPPPLIEQEPEEPTVYTAPTGVRRQRSDSSKPVEVL